jgi:hypothetical protein
MNRQRLAYTLIMILFASSLKGQVRWSADFNLGLPLNIPMPVTITQNYQPVISQFGIWSAEPFARPFNWMWRIGRWNWGRAWEFETMHHKMVLMNRPDEIQRFGITHGFNTLTLNRAREIGKVVLRYGAGGVLAHPESTIRDQVFNEKSGLFKSGYFLTGPIIMTSVSRPLRIGNSLLINLEGSITAGYARLPVASGSASLMHLAFHLHAGIGGSVGAKSAKGKDRKSVIPHYEL